MLTKAFTLAISAIAIVTAYHKLTILLPLLPAEVSASLPLTLACAAALLIWQGLAFAIAHLPPDFHHATGIAVAVLGIAMLTCLEWLPGDLGRILAQSLVTLYFTAYVLGAIHARRARRETPAAA